MTDIVDEIDALVDEQLSGYSERTGYDYNAAQDRCHHCSRTWHGLRITARMEEMRRSFQRELRRLEYIGEVEMGYAETVIDPDYRYAEDDSEVICPGSRFIGPWATGRQIEKMRAVSFAGDNPTSLWMSYDSIRSSLGYENRPRDVEFSVGWRDPAARSLAQVAAAFARLRDSGLLPPDPFAVTGWLEDDADPEPDARTTQERALHRPSTTPPMWAVDAGRQRRTHTNSRRRHR